ncbi:MAG: acireductone synthase [Gammaproteobacteria bacterium]|jgi:enolase-phosphatase E1|nr:acireductone synthase [Gammaproteobacteria bacterium]
MSAAAPAAILTDIEGTTSSLSFVKDTLFPYARRHLGAYVREHGGDPEVAACLDECRDIMGEPEADTARIIDQLERWIDEDRKVTPLKALQGLVWEHGYRARHFTGHIYDDALRKLRDWHARGLRLYIYSSGSVHAQKLLFAHTAAGDLTPLFSGYYDTRIGGKMEAESYRRIAADIGVSAERILFLSDLPRELDAARDAGMRTCQLLRDESATPAAGHPQARDFTEIGL